MKITNRFILVLIVLTAATLRFFNYFEIPFTHDEFSALFRLNFDSFSELIEKGVKIDGHPAGIQVFEYYWTKWFGAQEWILKLPFIIFGIAAVYLTYLIGKKWFNPTVGCIEFTVMYSQIARPYISGLFFSLLMVYYWSLLMIHPHKHFLKNGLLFVLSAALCAYNHHFSLLFAAIVGLSGLFFLPKKYLLKYMGLGVLIFALYIPHLNIFFHQLSVKGVELWLNKPKNDFLIDFVYYIFHYSIFNIVLVLIIIVLGFKGIRQRPVKIRWMLLAVVWFVLPFLIGFYYSKYVSAVLQYSVLIFSFPFLFFILFGHLKAYSAKVNLLLVAAILLTNILTLVYHRKYYDLFYHSPYKEILVEYQSLKKTHPNAIFIISSHEKITPYYVSQLQADTGFINYSQAFKDEKALKNYLETESQYHEQLFFGCLSSIPPHIVPLIQDYYPNIEVQKSYYGGTVYLFNKDNNKNKHLISYLDFDTPIPKHWQGIETSHYISLPMNNNKVYTLNNEQEWGPSFVMPLDKMIDSKKDFIDISVKVFDNTKNADLLLVGELISNGKQMYWGANNLATFRVPQDSSADWTNVHHSIKLSDLNLKYEDITFKTYIWNKGKTKVLINDFKIERRQGNPFIYGLIEKM